MQRGWLVLVVLAACSDPDGSTSRDPVIGFATPSSDADETDAFISIPLELSEPTDHTVSAVVSVTGGTATDGVDFEAAAGTYDFPPGVTSWNVDLTIVADSEPEAEETVELTVGSIEGARAGAVTHTFTIRSNLPPAPRARRH